VAKSRWLRIQCVNHVFALTLTFESGDRVLIYTDGVLEATNRNGEEYGTSRLVESMQAPRASAQTVLADVQEFARGGTLIDDATAIVLRRE
jgi:phosphoserine phosphatase RsbU/P